MSVLDWAAILGALAWSPHVIGWVGKLISKAKIRLVASRTVEIGFTTYGPIFNLRLAFSVDRKDIVISQIKVRLRHESGEERLMEWQGIVQHMGKMTLPNSDVMPYEKEHSVLAIKLNQKDIEERLVRFQDPGFIASQKEYLDKAAKKMAYLKGEKKYDGESFLREQEMTDLYSFNKHAFLWKNGKYTAKIEIQSQENFEIKDNLFEFSLSPIEIEQLQTNKDVIESSYRQVVLGTSDSEVQWRWVNPSLYHFKP